MNAKEIAEKFNKHFTKREKKYRPNSKNDGIPDYTKLKDFASQRKPDNAFFDILILNQDVVLKQLHRMSNPKSTGLDGIGIRLLKVSADIIALHMQW